MKMFPPLCAAAFSMLFAAGAPAEPLPDGAKPIAAKSLAAFYSGSTADWGNSMAYFAPDGSVKGVYTEDGGKKRPYQGNWTAKGNEVCMKVKVLNTDWDATTDCWKWYVGEGDQLWTLWSVHYDKTKPTENDYYTDEKKKIKRGDRVSKAFAKLAG